MMEWIILIIIATTTAIYIARSINETNPFTDNDLQLLLLRHKLLIAELQEANNSFQQGIIEERTYQEINGACSEEILQLEKKIEIIDNNYSQKS
ncbi:MAG: hypothetical protein ACJ0KD_02695 [Dehalococcoidia bacterium]